MAVKALVIAATVLATTATVAQSQTVGSFTAAPTMQASRQSHTETLLPDGTVLITGGCGSETGDPGACNPLASAVRYDPVLNAFLPTGGMAHGRYAHTATLLGNGTVLIAGGFGSDIASAEIYDPATGTFSSTGSMGVSRLIGQFPLQFRVTGRHSHTASRLPDGRVLLAGGSPGPSLDAEIYDPATGTFSAVGGHCVQVADGTSECGMLVRRISHTATPLLDGRVLITGGADATQAEIFDPATGQFHATGHMTTPRFLHGVTLLPGGRVLLTGGTSNGQVVASAEIYDPGTGSFSAIGSMQTARQAHSSTLITTRYVLLAGGTNEQGVAGQAEAFDLVTQSFLSVGAPMAQPRFSHTATALNTGAVLLAGGVAVANVLPGTELFQPAPRAIEGSLSAQEDLTVDSQLAGGPLGSALTFSIQTNGSLGTAVVTDSATGAFRYTPNRDVHGADSFTFTVASGAETSAPATVAIDIAPVNDAPVAEDGTASTPPGVGVTGVLTATDADSATLLYSIVSAGGKGTATITDPATGAFSYTPNSQATGTDTFTFQVSDGSLDSNIGTIAVTIAGSAPVAADGALGTAEDTAASGTLTATDADGQPLTFVIVVNGSKGSAVVTNPATGAFTYTSQPNVNGQDTFTFRSTDGVLESQVATVTVTIDPVDDAPVVTDGALSTPEDTAHAGTLIGSDVDSSLTFSIVTNGTRGTAAVVNPATGAFTYTPHANVHGSDTFTFRAGDASSQSNIGTMTVTIVPVNDLPTVTPGAVTTQEDTGVSGTLVGADVEGGVLTFVIVSNGTKGTATITNPASGAFQYLPQANANGPDSFTFRASDGAADSGVATVTVAIAAINDVPVATNGSLSTTIGTPVSGSLAAFDVDGDALVFAVVAAPVRGTVAITNPATGAFTYTPNAGATGTDVFTFKAADGAADSNVATVTVTISAVAPQPRVSLSPAQVSFAPQVVGSSSSPATITLSNTGNAPLVISSIGMTGVHATDFLLTPPTSCPASLAAGASCVIRVVFRPTNIQRREASIRIVSNAPGSPHGVSVEGTGRREDVRLTPNSVTFGTYVVTDTSPRQRFALTNHESLPVTLQLSVSADFAISSHTCGTILQPGRRCEISVVFKPTRGGSLTGTLNVLAGSGLLLTASLSGTALGPTNTLNLGTPAAGTTSPRGFSINNPGPNLPGSPSLIIKKIEIIGPDASSFSITDRTCGNRIPPASGCRIVVTFRAGAPGSVSEAFLVVEFVNRSPIVVRLIGRSM